MRSRGYTLVELTIAFAIMSFVFVILTVGIIQLYKIYQAGLAIRSTQQAARDAAEKITRDVQASNGSAVVNQTVNGRNFQIVCLFDDKNRNQGTMYYVRGASTSTYSNINRLTRAKFTGSTGGSVPCNPPASALSNIENITPDDISVSALSGNTASDGIPLIRLSLASNYDFGSVDSAGTACTGIYSQYCSVTTMRINIQGRVR